MKRVNMIKLTGGIIALVMLVAGSGVGTHIGSGAAKAIATCGDLVKCSRADYVLKVNNTGEGNALVAKGQSSSTNKAAVKGEATKRARGVYGKSKKGVGVFGESTTSHGIKGVTNSSNYDKAAVYGISTGNAHGVYGEHNSSGHYGILGSASVGVYGKHNSGGNYGYIGGYNTGVYGYSSAGQGVWGYSPNGYAGFFDGKVLIAKSLSLYPSGIPSKPITGCVIWCDSTSGDLKVKFSNGTVKTIATN